MWDHDSEPLQVRVGSSACIVHRHFGAGTHKRRRPFYAQVSPRGTCCQCKWATKHTTGLFLNNNTLSFPWTRAQMIINSILPGHRVGKWWSQCLDCCSRKAKLFNTCQHAIVSTIRIKVYRVIHIKCTCREAAVTLSERRGSDNCFFYHSDSGTRFTYGTSIVVAAMMRPLQQNNSWNLKTLQEKFEEKNLCVWNSPFFVFRVCCTCNGPVFSSTDFLLLMTRHLRLKACMWVPGTIWQESFLWAATGNKKGGRLEIWKSLTQPTLQSVTVLPGNNCA